MHYPSLDKFHTLADQGNMVPVYRQLFSDQLTPVQAFSRLSTATEPDQPAFLLESVVGGEHLARYSFIGFAPTEQITANATNVRHTRGGRTTNYSTPDPLSEIKRRTGDIRPVKLQELPDFTGGWVGYAGYDTVRYIEGEKLAAPPTDDRELPDMDFGLFDTLLVFDHVKKSILAIHNVRTDRFDSPDEAYQSGCDQVDRLVSQLIKTPDTLSPGEVTTELGMPAESASNMTQPQFHDMVDRAKEYIGAGDIFQVVLSQRFERKTSAHPFDLYRALRVVNPSPYMFYLRSNDCVLVGSSPEILCRVQDGVVTNRPLAGTRKRGMTADEDKALEEDLLSDPKERAEHIMLVDLGRNDVGKVSTPATVELPAIMEIERYSHVMHISSTVTGKLRDDLDAWDALQAALPVGTVSGAPKVRAMQIIDELEPNRRGPYAGAVGYTDFSGNMDMAIALRTMVVIKDKDSDQWIVHLQAGAGIVADSVPESEFQETVNKAAALGKAIELAECSFANH